jgi:hypothetical protein
MPIVDHDVFVLFVILMVVGLALLKAADKQGLARLGVDYERRPSRYRKRQKTQESFR